MVPKLINKDFEHNYDLKFRLKLQFLLHEPNTIMATLTM